MKITEKFPCPKCKRTVGVSKAGRLVKHRIRKHVGSHEVCSHSYKVAPKSP